MMAQHEDYSAMEDRDLLLHLREHREMTHRGIRAPVSVPEDARKCSFGLMSEIAFRLPSMHPSDVAEVQALLAQPNLQTSILSKSGRFRVHFDTVGRHTPAMLDASGVRIPGSAFEYADSVAAALDHVYNVQIGEIGYDAPPFETGQTAYRIYLLEYNGSYYGETYFTNPVSVPGAVRPTHACYMQMDNDYREYFSKGLDGMRVTAAHEFHHMVQIGSYGLWIQDRWMHEMTSTYYEEVVYPEVNDFLIYLRNFMRYPERSMYAWGSDGYELVLWPMMLEKRYDRTLMREMWTNMRRHEPIRAMRDAIASFGGDFSTEFCDWSKYNYFTASRAERLDPPMYEDAAIFPYMKLHATQEFLAGFARLSGAPHPLSAQYVRVARGLDSITFAIANVDLEAAMNRGGEGIPFELEVRETALDASWLTLSNGWAYKFTAAAPNALCLRVLDGGIMITREQRDPFPNPFDPMESSRMHFPLPRDVTVNRADLAVYTVSMDLVASKDNLTVMLLDDLGAAVSWDVMSDDGKPLGTGVYFYVLHYGSETVTGKFAVIAR